MMCILYIAGVDYIQVNDVTLTFTKNITSHRIDIITIDDEQFEGDGESEVICLRIVNLAEPCSNYVSIGKEVRVLIKDDDSKLPMYVCMFVLST